MENGTVSLLGAPWVQCMQGWEVERYITQNNGRQGLRSLLTGSPRHIWMIRYPESPRVTEEKETILTSTAVVAKSMPTLPTSAPPPI